MMVLAAVMIILGMLFLIVSAVGLIRLPDFYTRAHGVAKSETLGAILVLGGLAVYGGWDLTTVKVLVVLVFILIANPAATHAIARSAFLCRLQPWTRKRKEAMAGEAEEKPALKNTGGPE